MFKLSITIRDIPVKYFLKKTLNSFEKYTYFCEVRRYKLVILNQRITKAEN